MWLFIPSMKKKDVFSLGSFCEVKEFQVSRKSWLAIIVAFCFLFGSFFFFLGSVISIVSHLSGKSGKTGNIAVVEVLGTILDAKSTVETLRDLRNDKEAKAVILRVDSPGGSVGASQEIYEAVQELKSKKPVVVSMGTVAASGGYYIAAPATKIVANEGTITASIGVRMELMNVEDLLSWAKVKPFTLKSGRLKDVGSPTRPMTPEEKEYLESLLKAMHDQFKKAVAESRGLSMEEVEKFSDGRVVTGLQAKDLKLVDEVGGFDKAIHIAANLAGLKEEPEIYYPEQTHKEFWERFMESSVEKLTRTVMGVWMSPMRFSF